MTIFTFQVEARALPAVMFVVAFQHCRRDMNGCVAALVSAFDVAV
jgi:hypothetical protein